MTLSSRHLKFATEYLVDFNLTQAAIRAGYSKRSAYSTGSRMLKNAEILEYVRSQITNPDEVLSMLNDIAHGDIADLMSFTTSGYTIELAHKDNDGNLVVNPKTKLVKKIKQKVTTFLGRSDDSEDREIIETELELYDAQSALVTLGKFHKLFVDRTEITGENGEPIMIATVAPGLVEKLKRG